MNPSLLIKEFLTDLDDLKHVDNNHLCDCGNLDLEHLRHSINEIKEKYETLLKFSWVK